MAKRRNEKPTLKQRVEKTLKKLNRERKLEIVKTKNLEINYDINTVPLRINKSIRVNLNINPEEYNQFYDVGVALDPYFKFEKDPGKSQFYKDCVLTLHNLLSHIKQVSDDLEIKQRELDKTMNRWKLK